MHCGVVVVIVAGACGRLGFEAESRGDATDGDAAAARRPCGATTTAPDPLTIKGIAFEFLDFVNTRSPLANTKVDAFDDSDALVASAMTIADGTYTLAIPTAGQAPTLRLRYTRNSHFTTTTYFDAPLDHDVALGNQANLTLSDGPMWSTGSMGSVYSTVGETVDPMRGTINIGTLDCNDEPLAGVSVDVAPAPNAGAYLGSNGMPAPGVAATQLPFAFFVAYNAQATQTTITASAAGLDFVPQNRSIPPGDEVIRIIVRPLQ